MTGPILRVNLGGEGEVPGVLNQQGPWVLDPTWRSSRAGKTLQELLAQGHQFLITSNTNLPFAADSIEEVITNSVPIDVVTHRGPGVQSVEIKRILKPGGRWVRDGTVFYTKP
jgi:hypothetical protein